MSSSDRVGAAVLQIRVTPGASRRKISVMADGRIKLSVQSPPEKGRANQEVTEFLAECLGIAVSRIQVLSGHGSRNKKISIAGMSIQGVHQKLESWAVQDSNL